jgi:catechol 2,3-dioxygenase-like lactoylglutathione lyase family enzyme
MIKGVHAMFYSDEADALRAFLRDTLGLKAHDVGEGWLIFDVPEADMGVHPTDPKGRHGSPNGTQAISFYCENLEATMATLEDKGVEFPGGVVDEGWGLVTAMKAPGNLMLQLYEPRYSKGG